MFSVFQLLRHSEATRQGWPGKAAQYLFVDLHLNKSLSRTSKKVGDAALLLRNTVKCVNFACLATGLRIGKSVFIAAFLHTLATYFLFTNTIRLSVSILNFPRKSCFFLYFCIKAALSYSASQLRVLFHYRHHGKCHS